MGSGGDNMGTGLVGTLVYVCMGIEVGKLVSGLVGTLV